MVKKTAFLYLGVILLAAALVIQMPSVKTVLFQTVTVDNDLPVVSELQPSGTYYINNQPLEASARVTDATSGVSSANGVWFYVCDKGNVGSILDDDFTGFSVDNSGAYGGGTGSASLTGGVYTLTVSSGTYVASRKSVSINTNNFLGVMVRVKGTANSRWLIGVSTQYGDYWLQDGGIAASQAHWMLSTADFTAKYFAFAYAIQTDGSPHALAGSTVNRISVHTQTTDGNSASVSYDWLLYPTSGLQSCNAISPSSGSLNDGVWKAKFSFTLSEDFNGWSGILLAQAPDNASPWNVNGQSVDISFVKSGTSSLKWIQPSDNAIISGTYKFIVEAAGSPTSAKIQFTQGGTVKYEYALSQESGSNRWSANVDTTKIASGTYTVTAKSYKDGTELASLSVLLTIENDVTPKLAYADWLSIGLGVTGVLSIVYSRKVRLH